MSERRPASHVPAGHVAPRERRATRLARLLAVVVMLAGPARAADGPTTPERDEDPAVQAIRVYQQYLSSLRHVRCRFTPSCSEYAAQAITAYGLAEGSARAADRLMRCNASAVAVHPRGERGLLLDPVTPLAAGGPGTRVPAWLLPSPAPESPPAARELPTDRQAQVRDVLRFALELEWRGDCDRAATEYQRVASLVRGAATEARAFARIGGCQYAASRWPAAESAYLTSTMLSAGPEPRAEATWRAAASRFNAGSYAACSRLLEEGVLFPTAPVPLAAGDSLQMAAAPARASWDGAFRLPALGGLSGLARGEWSRAADSFRRAGELAPAADVRDRLVRLAEVAPRGESLAHRSSGLASTLSAVVPGAGQMYAGRWNDGARTLLFNAALILTVVSFARGEHVPAAVLTAAVAVPFYVGNVQGAGSAARRFDRRERERFLEEAIATSSR